MDRIQSASEPTIRAILVAVCDDDRLRARCLAYLDQLDGHAAATTGSPAGSDPRGPPPTAPGKRGPSAPPPRFCIRCRTAFGPGSDHPQACPRHGGRLVTDRSGGAWAGRDGDTSGPRDTDEDQERRPRGLSWSCCGGDGTWPGCARAPHVAVRGEHKRLRPPGPGQGPDATRMFEGRVLRPNKFVNENLWADMCDGSVAVGGDTSGISTGVDDDDDGREDVSHEAGRHGDGGGEAQDGAD